MGFTSPVRNTYYIYARILVFVSTKISLPSEIAKSALFVAPFPGLLRTRFHHIEKRGLRPTSVSESITLLGFLLTGCTMFWCMYVSFYVYTCTFIFLGWRVQQSPRQPSHEDSGTHVQNMCEFASQSPEPHVLQSVKQEGGATSKMVHGLLKVFASWIHVLWGWLM